jgi:HEPN domain-containing protein
MAELEYLKTRAKEFWEEITGLIQKEKYNLAAFNAEQACQLFVKYLIGIKVGDFPKTHYFSELIPALAKAHNNNKILDFYQKNELFFDDLEDAYFTSRYFPKTFSKNLIEMLIKSCEDFFRLLEEISGENIE